MRGRIRAYRRKRGFPRRPAKIVWTALPSCAVAGHPAGCLCAKRAA